ncbi:hypothetical protein IAT38_003685 [Cryptococcus sp. DSM 104549]
MVEFKTEDWALEESFGSLMLGIPNAIDVNDESFVGHTVGAVKDGLDMDAGARLPAIEAGLVEAISKSRMAYMRNKNTTPISLEAEILPDRDDAFTWDKENHLAPSTWKIKNKRVVHVAWGGPFACSSKRLQELEQVSSFSLLRCPSRNRGKAILCRVITGTKIGDGLLLHIEDAAGFALPLYITFPTPTPMSGLPSRILKRLYPIGTIMVIREPHVKFGSGGGYVMRVDVPVDIEELHPSSAMAFWIRWTTPPVVEHTDKTWVTTKDAGNLALKNSNHLIAVKHYSAALTHTEVQTDASKQVLLLLNRAQAYLDQRTFGWAYRDCTTTQRIIKRAQSSATDVQRAKLLWRMTNAAYGLRLYDRTEALVAECEVIPAVAAQAPQMRGKLRARRAEMQHGRYDWKAMFDEVHKSAAPNLDVADFMGPIAVDEIPGKGRGLVTTRPVRAGELLLVEKATLATFPCDAPDTIISCVDDKVRYPLHQPFVLAIERAVHRALDDPTIGLVLDGLTYEGHPTAKRLPELNMTDEERLRALDDPPPEIDPDRLHKILHANSLGNDPISHRPGGESTTSPHVGGGEAPVMLFGMASIANHSCSSNVTIAHWGDVVTFRALHDLPKGEELLIGYFDDYVPYQDRLARSRSWGFTCDCTLCRWDRRDSLLRASILSDESYAELVAESERLQMEDFDPGARGKNDMRTEEVVRRLRDVVRSVEATYCWERGGLKPELGVIWKRMATHLFFNEEPEPYIEALRNSLECHGAVFSTKAQRAAHGRVLESIYDGGDGMIKNMLFIAITYFKRTANRKEAMAWTRTACWAHQLLYGGGQDGVALFKERYQGLYPDNMQLD